jgi:hypothetical protein
MAPSGAMTIFGISSVSGHGSTRGSGATRSGGITRGGGVGAPTSTWGPLLIFNLVVEFFYELQQNYQEGRI